MSHYVCTEGIVFKSKIFLIIDFFPDLNIMFSKFFLYIFRLKLKPKGKILTYGPHTDNYKLTPARKFDFDINLKMHYVKWGLRYITHQLIPNAFMYGFTLTDNLGTYKDETPSDNRFLVWSKTM